MKKLLTPGFELTFALGLIAIFMLPPFVMAQQRNELKVTITNHDTTINGKNIKDLSATERKEALKKMDNLHRDMDMKVNGHTDTGKHFVVRMRKNNDDIREIVIEKQGGPGDVIARIPNLERNFTYRTGTDSAGHVEIRKMFRRQGDDMMPDMNMTFTPNGRGGDGPEVLTYNMRGPATRFNHRNSQAFTYAYTDNDGISTHFNFNTGDANPENVKRITGAEKAELELKDFTITPLFSSGKTVISFSLPAAAAAEVWLKNTEGKVIWADKAAGGSFTKSFALPINGVYYLQVKQAGKTGLKRITKEQ